MTSEPSARVLRENPYHDRVEGNVLVYTAAGKEGKQAFTGINRRLLDQPQSTYPIHAFTNIGSRRDVSLGPRRWRYLGLLQYLRHFSETQLDSRMQPREALVFEFLIHSSIPKVIVSRDDNAYASSLQMAPLAGLADAMDRDVVGSQDFQLGARDQSTPEIENIRRSLLALSPVQFEHTVKVALAGSGFEEVTVTRASGDGGIDVQAIAGRGLWPYAGTMLQVQAKRWIHSVGRREVAELRGSLQPTANGAVVTTSFFTQAAIIEAREVTKKPIVLINGFEFSSVLARLNQAIS